MRHGVPATLQHLLVPVDGLTPYQRNPRNGDTDAIVESLRVNQQYRPIVVRSGTGEVLAGNHTLAAAMELGWTHIAATYVECTAEEAARIVLVDNRSNDLARYDDALLAELLTDLPGLEGTGFDQRALEELLAGLNPPEPDGDGDGLPEGTSRLTLADRFGVPPFSVLDARKGWWQERKREWLSTGIQSELGRGNALIAGEETDAEGGERTRSGAYGARATTGPDGTLSYETTVGATSIFDPVLCELVYRWFSAEGHHVLDPWAGGSVRGITAATLGRRYTGIELRPEQVAANEAQLGLLPHRAPTPTWIEGESAQELRQLEEGAYDLIFGCPPYYSLERYSDDPRDLSTLTPEQFDAAYAANIAEAARCLRHNAFAVFVVGNVRHPSGRLMDLGGVTTRACEAAGLQLYNDGILVTPAGSLPVRAARAFSASRVLGRTHQQVLVYVKGDRRKAADRCGTVSVTEALDEAELTEEGRAALLDARTAPDADALEATPPSAVLLTAPAEGTTLVPAEGGTTAVEQWGDVLVKRDDLFAVGDLQGGKVRSCHSLLTQPGVTGAVTAGSRHSPQVEIVAGLAARLGLPCAVHVPAGDDTPALAYAAEQGAEVHRHRPGHNSVIVARARADAQARGWLEVPFGMECPEAVHATAGQAASLLRLPTPPTRIVVPVGSGMSLAGILHGLQAAELHVPVLGIVVGADPRKRLQKYAPEGWEQQCQLQPSGLPYEKTPEHTSLGGLQLDPVYEAKCLPYLQPGDLLWVVGRRRTLHHEPHP